MKTLVIYDSTYGNTEKIAQAISETTGAYLMRATDVKPADLKEFDLLIVGSPTHGGWYTEGIQALLKASPRLEGVPAALFDTRTQKSLFGFAANRLAKTLEKNGGKLLAPPEGFIVLGVKGPLKDGEADRAKTWARTLDRIR